MSVTLRPRLEAIAQMLSPLQLFSVADVGCDHGKLTAALLQRNIAKHVFASDISADSLSKARYLIERCSLTSKVTFHCASGIEHLSAKQADAIVFAGMGGELIAKLISESYKCAQTATAIIMQPMRGIQELRYYLYNNGFAVFDERIVLDAGRYYQLIAAKSGQMILPSFYPKQCYNYGVISLLKGDPLLPDLLNKDLVGLKKRLSQANSRGVDLPKLNLEVTIIEDLLRIIKELNINEKA